MFGLNTALPYLWKDGISNTIKNKKRQSQLKSFPKATPPKLAEPNILPSKYQFGLPLVRQEDMFKTIYGIEAES